jgi:outer membrane protein OmpA-like peptidoglycan-associated protein
MPSYLDFNATKSIRDRMLGKTLQQPNGPQTFTSSNYNVMTLSDSANVDPGAVTDLVKSELTVMSNTNVFKPSEFIVKEELYTLPRRANLRLYPYFQTNQDHNIISIFATDNYDNESELFKFAARNLKDDKAGPLFARIQQNLEAATIGRIRPLDTTTSSTLDVLTGRQPLIQKNYKITTSKTLVGQALDFVQTVAGTQWPYTEIPGDYLTNPANPVNYRPTPSSQFGKVWQDVTGALGSLIGIQRRPKLSRKPSDLLIEYMGDGQQQQLYNNLSFSKYKPDYTTSGRSQNSSKLFGFADKFAQGVKSVLGIEAPKPNVYIGDDRGEDVYYATTDFNGREVRSNFYLSLMFDPIQARLFQRKRNISEGGQISGKLTWISTQSNKKIIGKHNKEFQSEANRYNESLSTAFNFRDDSILGYTQEILNSLPRDLGQAKSHVANVIDQTTRAFKEGDVMMSRGSAIKYTDKFTGEESGIEYCRVWTKDRSYLNYSDTMKRTGLIRKFNDSVLENPWNLNIAPMSNGKEGDDAFSGSSNIKEGANGFYAKKYMFSIENLAWKTSNRDGFRYTDLPYCERGPNGGRVMWFPPYDLKFSENNSAQWEPNAFLGRTEPIYTYKNTERSGTVSFKVVVDHPSILNLLTRRHFESMSDEEAENYISAFFAGCEELDFYDLIRKYTKLTPTDLELIIIYLDYIKGHKSDTYYKLKFHQEAGKMTETNPTTIEQNYNPPIDGDSNPETGGFLFDADLYFINDKPSPKNSLYADTSYDTQYSDYQNIKSSYLTKLQNGLNAIFSSNSVNNKKDRKTLFNSETPDQVASIANMTDLLNKGFDDLDATYLKLTGATATIKSDIEAKSTDSVTIEMQSSTSFVADENYNLKLSFRRAHSVAQYVLKSISKNNTAPTIKWKTTLAECDVKPAPSDKSESIEVSFKDLGYPEDIKGTVKINLTMLGENATASDCGGVSNCHSAEILNESGLKVAAPITFRCRHTHLKLFYNKIQNPIIDGNENPVIDPNENPGIDTYEPGRTSIDVEPVKVPRKPPLDALKFIIMKTLSECHYFKQLDETSPLVFSSLKERLKYFHPGFHSMTPEGLNSRLTFLQQCLRPGDTVPIKSLLDESSLDARNTAFGPPPICILRIGDFYHSKVLIKDLQITFENSTLDLNPEGIGVQPMIADVTLQINFIGGQGLKEPVAQLQNALSFNFYGNTEVYDHRSTATEDRTEFNKTELEKFLAANVSTPKRPQTSVSPNNPVLGDYIGSYKGTTVSYDKYIITDGDENIFSSTKKYFDEYSTKYNELLIKWGGLILPIFVSPTYRTKNKVDVKTGVSSTVQIELLGQYKKGREFSVLAEEFRTALVSKYNSLSSISSFLGFDPILANDTIRIKRSDDIIKNHILGIINNNMDVLSSEKMDSIESGRNKIINTIDRLNFVISGGIDGKLEKDNKTTGLQLNNFNDANFYEKYSKVIDFITKETTESFNNGLDATIDFGNLRSGSSISDDTFKKILGVFFKKEVTGIADLYKTNTLDDKLFTTHIIKKITNKLEDLVITTKEKKIKFKHPTAKNSKAIEYTTTSYNLSTAEASALGNIHNQADKSDDTKLNFIR